ncbi:MAG TPA: hypothetical protein VKZ60_08425 [Chloroflexota bacterium]|nr:hypothetical protein [Chloroflexota bacterium]
MPLAPVVRRWRLFAAACLVAAAVASPALAQGPRNPVVYILMGDHYFLPASVTVQPRTTVVFLNQSGGTWHRVRSALWDSGPMAPGQAFWRTFDVPGEYWFQDPDYADQGMAGYVIVQYGAPVATRTPLPTPRPSPPPAPPAPPAAAPAATPAAGASPGPLGATPAAAASPAPGTPAPAASPSPAATPRAETPMDPGASVVPGDEAGADEAPAELPLPVVGAALLAVGLILGERQRRPRP